MGIPIYLRPRVERLLRGSRDERDISSVFKWARSKANNGSLVKEIGDFDAHRDERDKGVTWNTARAFCDVQRVGAIGMAHGLPPSIPSLKRAIISQFNLVPAAEFKKQTGKSQSKVRDALNSALNKIEQTDGIVELFNPPLSNFEHIIFQSFRTMQSVSTAFTAQKLTRELSIILLQKGALRREELASFLSLENFIGIFAVMCMHMSKIDLKETEGTGILKAGMSPNTPGCLVVFIRYRPAEQSKHQSTVPIFLTRCDYREYLDPKLWPAFLKQPFLSINGSEDWDLPLELDAGGRLTRLR